MGNADYGIPRALVFCNDNVSTNGNIVYLPIYLVAYLKKEVIGEVIYDVDLEGLEGHGNTKKNYIFFGIPLAYAYLCIRKSKNTRL